MDGGGPLYYSSITHLVIRTAARDEDKWSWTASPFFRHPRSPWLDLVVRKQWEMGTTRRDSFPTGNPRWNWFNADTWPVVAFTYFFWTLIEFHPWDGWMDGACVQWRHLASATFRGIFRIFETINFSSLIFFFFPSPLSLSLSFQESRPWIEMKRVASYFWFSALCWAIIESIPTATPVYPGEGDTLFFPRVQLSP